MSVDPPFPKLPSLNALRAFEAAARLGGFALAAAELRGPPGAIAAQIKSLEEELGAPLFERHARGVRLTALGQRALPEFVTVFDTLGQAVQDLRMRARPNRIHIAALPALAQISVSAVEVPPNLKRVPYDLCLFYTDPLPAGAISLGQDAIFPVCTPQVAKNLRGPQGLADVPCLTDTTWAQDWDIWAQSAAPGLVRSGPAFSLYALALEEALAGAGVLMARRALVAQYLDSGALEAPFAAQVPVPQHLAAWVLPGKRADGALAQVMMTLGRLA